MKKVAVVGFAVTLGLLGCRGGNNAGGGAGAGGTGDAESSGDATPARNAQSGSSASAMETYTVEVQGDQVTLRPQSAGGGSDVQTQSGREIQVSQDEFRRLAGTDAKQGDIVEVQVGSDQKPSKIMKRSGTEQNPGTMTPESGSGSGTQQPGSSGQSGQSGQSGTSPNQ